jgi:adenosylcobinamide-GDP ribazoletransferase
MRLIAHELRLFLIACQFLTRMPIPLWVGFEPAWLQDSARYFPAVGLGVGAIAAALLAICHWLFSPGVAAVLSVIGTVFLTGAFHEDGWADTCDGLGGVVSRERALQIMKDSRIGAYGAVGIVLMLSLKIATLAGLPLHWALIVSVWSHGASRWSAVTLLRLLPYAGDVEHAKAKPMAQSITNTGWAIATAWMAGATLLAWVISPAAIWVWGVLGAVNIALAWALGSWFSKRLGGVTGDTLGATQQVCEVGSLLAALAVWRLGALG